MGNRDADVAGRSARAASAVLDAGPVPTAPAVATSGGSTGSSRSAMGTSLVRGRRGRRRRHRAPGRPARTSGEPGDPRRAADACYELAPSACSIFCTCCCTWASSTSNMAPLIPAVCSGRFGILLVGRQQAQRHGAHLRGLPRLLGPVGHEDVVALAGVLPQVEQLGHDVGVLGGAAPPGADVPDRLPLAEPDGAGDQLGLGHVEPVVTRRRPGAGQQLRSGRSCRRSSAGRRGPRSAGRARRGWRTSP